MTTAARQQSATRLGAGRWRVTLAFATSPDVLPPRPHPRDVALRGEPDGAAVETLTVPRPSAPRTFSVVLSVPEPAPGIAPRYVIGGQGWTAEIELPQARGPGAGTPSRPAAIDYRARDFGALMGMLTQVVDERTGPGLTDHPVSETSALVEELAYLGDALSYSQDGVATEAYLASARRRISVCRHAELLDYRVDPGRSARVWVRFTVSQPVSLPASTMLLGGVPELPARVPVDALPAALAAGALVYETLQGGSGTLREGELVLIAPADAWATPAGQVVRLTGVRRRGANTLIEWSESDALADDEALTTVAVQVQTGNLVLADQARTYAAPHALPPPVAGERYWPELPVRFPAFTPVPPEPVADPSLSAAETLAAAGRPVGPAVQLVCGQQPRQRPWFIRDSLLDSSPFDPACVVEVEDDGRARLRFGDGTNGMRPPVGAAFQVSMRSGGGSAGNVGIGAITHLVGDAPAGVTVHNPVPAVGGADPEPLQTVRLQAPVAFRITDRAVTAAQFSAAAREIEGVAGATTHLGPAGTGPLAQVRVHAGDWTVPTAALVEQVQTLLAGRRTVGVAVDVRGAQPKPVTIALDVTVAPGWALAAMAAAVDEAFDAELTKPGHFTFGTSLHRSEVVRLITPLPGVVDVTVRTFRFTGDPPGTPAREELAPGFGQILRIDNDPSAPEQGSVSFRLMGQDE